jgi:hypothetical protein
LSDGNSSLNFCIHTIIGGLGPQIIPNSHAFLAATIRHKFFGQLLAAQGPQ